VPRFPYDGDRIELNRGRPVRPQGGARPRSNPATPSSSTARSSARRPSPSNRVRGSTRTTPRAGAGVATSPRPRRRWPDVPCPDPVSPCPRGRPTRLRQPWTRTAALTGRRRPELRPVAPSVICSHIVAQRIADATDGAICTPHDHGCAQIGSDHEQTERTLLNIAQNPNVAGVTVVGLGCEHLQSGPFAQRIEDAGVTVRETAIQDAGGTDACLEEGTQLTAELATDAASVGTAEASLGDLTVGVVSSDLDASTRDVADPLVARRSTRSSTPAHASPSPAASGSRHYADAGRRARRVRRDRRRAARRGRTYHGPAGERSRTRPSCRGRILRVGRRNLGDASVDEFVPYGTSAVSRRGIRRRRRPIPLRGSHDGPRGGRRVGRRPRHRRGDPDGAPGRPRTSR